MHNSSSDTSCVRAALCILLLHTASIVSSNLSSSVVRLSPVVFFVVNWCASRACERGTLHSSSPDTRAVGRLTSSSVDCWQISASSPDTQEKQSLSEGEPETFAEARGQTTRGHSRSDSISAPGCGLHAIVVLHDTVVIAAVKRGHSSSGLGCGFHVIQHVQLDVPSERSRPSYERYKSSIFPAGEPRTCITNAETSTTSEALGLNCRFVVHSGSVGLRAAKEKPGPQLRTHARTHVCARAHKQHHRAAQCHTYNHWHKAHEGSAESAQPALGTTRASAMQSQSSRHL